MTRVIERSNCNLVVRSYDTAFALLLAGVRKVLGAWTRRDWESNDLYSLR
jgi:hypothetical protein